MDEIAPPLGVILGLVPRTQLSAALAALAVLKVRAAAAVSALCASPGGPLGLGHKAQSVGWVGRPLAGVLRRPSFRRNSTSQGPVLRTCLKLLGYAGMGLGAKIDIQWPANPTYDLQTDFGITTNLSIGFPPSPLRGEGRGGGDGSVVQVARSHPHLTRAKSIFVKYKNRAALSSPLKGEEAKDREN
jgi:hypothetical protein